MFPSKLKITTQTYEQIMKYQYIIIMYVSTHFCQRLKLK